MIQFVRHIFTIAIISTLFSAAVGATEKPLPPIEDFISPALIEPDSISLSPDGSYLAIIVPRENRSDLIIFDRASMKPTANITPAKNEHIADYWWVSNRRLVATFKVKEGGLETPLFTGELWGIDADGKNNKYLFGYRGADETGTHIGGVTQKDASATVLEPLADENDFILIGITQWAFGAGEAPYMELAKLNVKNGRYIRTGGRLPIRNLHGSVNDHDGNVRLVSGYTDEGYSQLFYRADKNGAWLKINDEKESGRHIEPLAYSEDNQQVYAVVSDNKNLDHLVLFNPVNKAEKLIYKPKTADVDELYLTANRKDAYAIRTYDGRGGYAFLKSDSPETKLVKEMMQQFSGELVIANSFTLDGKFATLKVASDINPGDYYLYDRDNKSVKRIFKSRPKLDVNQSASVEPIELKARDGLTLRGWVTKPNNAGERTPLVVLPHGGPYGVVDRWGYDTETQLLASRGYTVLQINFRGSGGYGRAFVDAGVGEWGNKMQHDITDATKWLVSQGKVDAAKICIYGASYGAYAAMMAVATEPSVFRCAIGYAGVYDLDIFQKQGDINDTSRGRNYLSTVMQEDKDWIRKHSPTSLANQIKAPVLLIHGGMDRRTPPAHANAMRKALKQAGNEPEWIYKTSEGHGFYNEENRLEVYQAIIKFLDKHIAPAKP
jgi:dipeptidyl aminopeptidase/acylaminoacyl peptidase